MGTYKYRMILSWSERDHLWIVDVPALPGCFADGATPQEAIDNTQVIIAEWIETAQIDGRPIPQPEEYASVAAGA